MSFLTRVAPVYNTTARISPVLTVTAARCISSTARLERGPVETTKDTLKKADRTVSNAAVKGLEKGERARDRLRDSIGIENQEAKERTEHLKGDVAEVAGQGRGKAEQALGESKSEVKGITGKMG